MSGLSQIQPSAAASSTLTLPQQTQQQAQQSIQQDISALGGYQQYRPGQANYLTQQQVFNPFAPQAMQGAQQAAQFGAGAAQNQFNLGGNLESLGQQVSASGQPLLQDASKVMQTAFDPQSALYQQYLQNVQQQQNAQMALSGVGSTPYAAGLNSQQLQQFNIAWQAQQLANQVQGLNAATGAYGMYGNLAQAGAGISGQGAQLQAGAPQLAMQSALYPYQTSEMMGQEGMQALMALQQYGVGGTQIPQLGVTDWSQLLGLGGQLQNVNTQSALAQSQIQSQNMQQIIKAIAGGAGLAAAPFTGGASLGMGMMGGLGGLGQIAGPQNNPWQGGGMGGWSYM